MALLLAAVAAFAGALLANDRAHSRAGIGALLATAHGQVWLGVDDRLWRATRDGALQHDDALAALGLPRAPANLLQAPDGRVLATVRDDPTLYVLDTDSAMVVGRITPQWPADIAQHGGRAINLSVHADGRIAIATGGGHLVALFNRQGAYLGRTAAQTYRYTNGLWWVGNALWTTDTNRFALKRLDPTTLAVAETVALDSDKASRFLGPARANPTGGEPMAALVRFDNNMTTGRVVTVSGSGQETALAHARFEPRDVAWLGSDVIASDGQSRSVLRWRTDGTPLPAFGDSALQARLAQGHAQRDADLRQDLQLRVLAAVLFLAALGCALRASQLRRRVREIKPDSLA